MSMHAMLKLSLLVAIDLCSSQAVVANYSWVAASCKPDGKSLGGGRPYPGKTLEQCTMMCNGNTLCAGFHFITNGGSCQLVTGVDKEVAVKASGNCTAASCCYGRPLAAPKTYSHVAARCKPDGKTIGTETAGKTLVECTNLCNADVLCAGFEFEFATGECEKVSGVDKEAALKDEDGPCSGESCCYGRPLAAPTGYSHVAARCKPDGKTIGTEVAGKTLVECTKICTDTVACAAFEFEFATGECEMVSAVDKVAALKDEDGPCSGESCCYQNSARVVAAPTNKPVSSGTTAAVSNTTKGKEAEASQAALMHPSLVVVSSVLLFLNCKV